MKSKIKSFNAVHREKLVVLPLKTKQSKWTRCMFDVEQNALQQNTHGWKNATKENSRKKLKTM